MIVFRLSLFPIGEAFSSSYSSQFSAAPSSLLTRCLPRWLCFSSIFFPSVCCGVAPSPKCSCGVLSVLLRDQSSKSWLLVSPGAHSFPLPLASATGRCRPSLFDSPRTVLLFSHRTCLRSVFVPTSPIYRHWASLHSFSCYLARWCHVLSCYLASWCHVLILSHLPRQPVSLLGLYQEAIKFL